jgi:hypothetical protein
MVFGVRRLVVAFTPLRKQRQNGYKSPHFKADIFMTTAGELSDKLFAATLRSFRCVMTHMFADRIRMAHEIN